MARKRWLDHLQNYPFWLFDIPRIGFISSPFVFTPLFGFSEITAPEYTANVSSFREGNWYFPRHFVTGGEYNALTLQRGVTMYDLDFYNWVLGSITGGQYVQAVRRSLILIHWTEIGDSSDGPVNDWSPIKNLALRVPGRAWKLTDCIPIRYKSGSDFDAKGSEVSLAEVDIQPEKVEEFSLIGTMRQLLPIV